MELPAHDVAKQGYLRFKGKMGIWQKQWAVLKKKSSKGGRRLERYSDEKSSYNNNPADKAIILEGVVAIRQLAPDIKKHALAISFSDKDTPIRSFCCDSAIEAAAWQVALQSLCLSKDVPAAAPCSSMGGIDLLQSGPSQKELTEVFNVYLLPCLNLAFYGECMLQVTQENMHLLEANNPGKRLNSWPLNSLRRYGSDDTKFTFESGRFCDTGEGIFILTTKDADAIYKKVHTAALAIAEMHRLVRKHDALTTRTQSVPYGQRDPHPAPIRSISSPGPSLQGPEPPPRPMGPLAPQGRKLSSAVDLSLPPVPFTGLLNSAPIPTGEYLMCASGGTTYNDTDLPPPKEMAPPLPNNTGYLPMTRDLERDEYVSLKNRQDGHYLSLKRPNELLPSADGIRPPGPVPPGGEPASSRATYMNQYPQEEVYGGQQPVSTRGEAQPAIHWAPRGVGEARGAVPGPPGWAAVAGQIQEDVDYIYAEKGLSPAFRCFLKERKEDEK